MILSCIINNIKSFVQKYVSIKNDVEYYLSLSVDRADFERRERYLKYKGFL